MMSDFEAMWGEGKGGFEESVESDGSVGESGCSITPREGSGGKHRRKHADRGTESVEEEGTQESLGEELGKGEESSEDGINGAESSEEELGNEVGVSREMCDIMSTKDANQANEGYNSEVKVHGDVEEGEVSDSDDEASSQERLDSLV